MIADALENPVHLHQSDGHLGEVADVFFPELTQTTRSRRDQLEQNILMTCTAVQKRLNMIGEIVRIGMNRPMREFVDIVRAKAAHRRERNHLRGPRTGAIGEHEARNDLRLDQLVEHLGGRLVAIMVKAPRPRRPSARVEAQIRHPG